MLGIHVLPFTIPCKVLFLLATSHAHTSNCNLQTSYLLFVNRYQLVSCYRNRSIDNKMLGACMLLHLWSFHIAKKMIRLYINKYVQHSYYSIAIPNSSNSPVISKLVMICYGRSSKFLQKINYKISTLNHLCNVSLPLRHRQLQCVSSK